MDEKEFGTRAAEALHRLETALTDVDGLEADLAADILTLEFDDGTKFVINSHTAARQIWLSANLTAAHFGWDGASWRDTKDGKELFAHVGALVSGRLARPVSLKS